MYNTSSLLVISARRGEAVKGREGGEMKNQHRMINGGLGAGSAPAAAIGRQRRGGRGGVQQPARTKDTPRLLSEMENKWN